MIVGFKGLINLYKKGLIKLNIWISIQLIDNDQKYHPTFS